MFLRSVGWRQGFFIIHEDGGVMTEQAVQDGREAEADSLVEQGKELVQEQTRAARGVASQKIGQRVESGSKHVGDQLLEIVQGLTHTSKSLRAEGKEQPAAVLEGITSRAQSVGNYLTQTNPERMLHDFEHFGRRKPWIAIAAGVAVGLATSRFLKASSSRRFEDLRAQGYSSRGSWSAAHRGVAAGSYAMPPAVPSNPELG
jgi:ElaB/YqjD/DUF883 family membrane-anchored ribosome-binding protein